MARCRRRQPRRSLEHLARAAADLETLAILLLSDANNSEEELVALAILKIALSKDKDAQCSSRYGSRGSYSWKKCEEFFDLLLHSFPVRWFKAWLRMGRDAFWHLHDLIAADAAFQSTANRPQRPVRYQLATFLCRVGAETAVKTASVMAVAEGSVYNYVQRVIGAIRHLRSNYLAWPGEARRHFISEKFAEQGFPGCLGTADGCLFRLTNQPLVNPYAYWCRKKFYALIMQATVDHRGVFTSHELGWPGSVQDSRVFRNSHLWLHREKYFRAHEYILVDKGYPLTKFTICPFNDYDLTSNPLEARRRKKWNRQLSCMHIFVEHGFGRLKGRFPILRCIPSRHLGEAYKMIESLMIVHNILEVIGDDPYTITGFTGSGGEQEVTDSTVEVAERDADLEGDDFYRTGLLRRKLLMDKYSMF